MSIPLPIIAVLAAAFIDDPALAWIFPDAARRPARPRRRRSVRRGSSTLRKTRSR